MNEDFHEDEFEPHADLEPLVPEQLPEESDAQFDGRVNEYRAASIRFMAFFDSSMAFVMSYENPTLAAWVIAIATGRTALTGGITQQELAERLGVTKAAVNKACQQVRARFGPALEGLNSLPGQRSQQARHHMAQARLAQLTK